MAACEDKVVFTPAQMKELLKLASFAMRQTYRVASDAEAGFLAMRGFLLKAWSE